MTGSNDCEDRVAKLEKQMKEQQTVIEELRKAGEGGGGKKKRVKDPNRPKTDYQKYMSKRMGELKQEHPDKKHPDIFSMAAKEWGKHKNSSE